MHFEGLIEVGLYFDICVVPTTKLAGVWFLYYESMEAPIKVKGT